MTRSFTNLQQASNATQNTTTSSTFSTQVSVATTGAANGVNQYVFWSTIAGLTVLSGFPRRPEHRLQDQTGAVTLCDNLYDGASTSTRYGFGGFARVSFSNSTNKTLAVEYADPDTSTTLCRDAWLTVLDADATDAYAESLALQTTTSTTPQTACTLTFTPGTAGDYYILFYAEANWTTSGGTEEVKAVDNSGVDVSVYTPDGNWNGNNNSHPYRVVIKKTLAASSQTFTIKHRVTSSGTSRIQNCRILALRADSFDGSVYAESRTTSTTTSSTAQTKLTSTVTEPSLPFLTLGCAYVDSNATEATVTNDSDTTRAGTAVALESKWVGDRTHWSASYVTGAGSSVTYLNRFRSDNNSSTVRTSDSVLLHLPLGVNSISGTLGVTEDDDAISSAGALAIAGTASVTEDDDSSAITGTLAISGVVDVIEDDDTIDAGQLPLPSRFRQGGGRPRRFRGL